ncbi:MAG: 3'(2'),5'-bisphosphate nucleotidase CysQ [Bacteroidales bacterium]|jgi:3'(2'), 5'-bisphosphate nucleotidase|nr:3'(2'),5'-bisphosphate nucleotidase CysQ [Bacteroidales bacterium]
MHTDAIKTLVWEALKVSVEAGQAILEVYETDFEVQNKSDNSPLTKADMKSHNAICEALESTKLPILSEEGKGIAFEERKQWEQFWLVDPLDGTKEFVNRNGEFTVNIALIEGSYPIAGVIFIPVTDELFVGINGMGAYKCQDLKAVLKSCNSFDDLIAHAQELPLAREERPFTVVCSRSHMSSETEAYIEELKTDHPDLDFASRGSSLKLCMVAEGKADVYPRFAPTMEWDTAAGQAIAEASGAIVINAHTKLRLNYNKENLLNEWFIVRR